MENKMDRDMKSITIKSSLLVLCALTLAACGVRGTPNVPPPMWGEANEGQSGDTLPANPAPDTKPIGEDPKDEEDSE
jgi:predicted small lipoprotein YifL